jgi:hypothetical protein
MRFAANCEWQCHLQLAEGGGWGNASYTSQGRLEPKWPRNSDIQATGNNGHYYVTPSLLLPPNQRAWAISQLFLQKCEDKALRP